MGRTLFWYLFRDLARIFVLASVVIAGIMSFGGLLRPLTHFGLDPMRVGQMWLYLMPAMMSYSMPVAAVFASSIVYGRLAADNELTACRAAGLSYASVALPGLTLGIAASICSLVMLGFVVPFFFLQAERIVYGNVARYIAAGIERTHTLPLKGGPTIFAQQAYIPPDLQRDDEQTVVLIQPTLIDYEGDPEDPTLKIPKSFSIAEEATLYIRQSDDGESDIRGVLVGVTSFPRQLGVRPQGGLERTEFRISRPSLIRQEVKFMGIARLKELISRPEETERVRRELAGFIEREQREILFDQIAETLKTRPTDGYVFESAERYVLRAAGGRWWRSEKGLRVEAGSQPLRITRVESAERTRTYEARAVDVEADMDNVADRIVISLKMEDVSLLDMGDRIAKSSDRQVLSIPMGEAIRRIEDRKVADYFQNDWQSDEARRVLKQRVLTSMNEATAELHSRVSFALSCLVLVLVGTALGMLLRSGDFLSAFAVSVIPALVSITLVVAGAQTAKDVTASLQQSLGLGLSLIWAGNAISILLAAWLFRRLRKGN